MIWQISKVLIAAVVISFSSWLAGKQPRLAGFIMALPISTLIALALSQAEYQDSAKSVAFAKSVFLAVPLSLLFFIPFLLANKLPLGFWGLYVSGIVLLAAGYFVHYSLSA